MFETWKLAKSALLCSRCSTEFRPGQSFFSALSEQQQELAREDFCPPCWEQASKDELFCFWKTRRLSGERMPRLDTEVVFDLFENLKHADRADREQLRFVLALYLTRRKALRLAGVSRDDGRELLEFFRPRREETYRVENPHLTEEQIGSATEYLKELFQAEL